MTLARARHITSLWAAVILWGSFAALLIGGTPAQDAKAVAVATAAVQPG